LGLTLAACLFVTTGSGPWAAAGWCFCFALAAWALPRALSRDDIADREIVVDRFAGVWIAAGPIIPASGLALAQGPHILVALLALPLLLYSLLLGGPLRRLGQSQMIWARIGDDLLAGILAMAGALAILGLLLGAF